MRKSTIVVAVLAATVSTASAAPSSSKLRPGASFQGKSVAAANGPAAQPQAPLGASAFTSARNAGATPVLQAATPVPQAKPARGLSRAQRLAGGPVRSRVVALSREVPYERVARPAEVSAAAAPRGSIQSMVTAEAQRAGVSPALGHAVVRVESMYNPRATGRGGYIGLMQLSYQTAKGMGYRGSRAGLYEPSTNLRYGMRYLAQAHAKAGGSTCGAVSKYQGGHGVRGVTRAGAVYCGKVRRFMASR